MAARQHTDASLRRRRRGSVLVMIAMVLTVVGQLIGPTGPWGVAVVVAGVLLFAWAGADAIRTHRAIRRQDGQTSG